jgi:hypothetical protein
MHTTLSPLRRLALRSFALLLLGVLPLAAQETPIGHFNAGVKK